MKIHTGLLSFRMGVTQTWHLKDCKGPDPHDHQHPVNIINIKHLEWI